MKLFKLFSLLGLFSLAVLATGCSNDDFQQKGEPSSDIITITASTPSEGNESTRVAFDKGNFSLSWKVGDEFQVYGAESAGEKFTCSSIAGGKGAFNGTKPTFTGVKHAYYPASKTNNSSDGEGYNVASFDYSGQIQIGNDNVDELTNYMYMTGTVSADNTVSDFVLQPVVLKLTIQMPSGFTGSVSQVDVQFGTTPMKSKHYQSVDWQDFDKTSTVQSVLLDGVNLAADENLVVYMAMSPVRVTNDTFTITVTDGANNKYVRTLENFSYNFESGKVVPGLFSVEQSIDNLVTIAQARQYYANQSTTDLVTYSKSVIGVVTASLSGKTFISDGVSGLYVEKSLPNDIHEGDNVVVSLTGLDVVGGRLEAYADSYAAYASGSLTLSDVLVERTIPEISASASSNEDPNVPVYTVIRGATLTSLDKGSFISQNGHSIKIYASSFSGDIPTGICDVYGVNYSNGYEQQFVVTNVVAGEAIPYMSFTVDPTENILADGQDVTVSVKSNIAWKVVLKQGDTEISSQEGANSQDVTVAIPVNESITESASYSVELICLDTEAALTAEPVGLTQLKAGEKPISEEITLLQFHNIIAGWTLPNSSVSDIIVRGFVVYQEASKVYVTDGTAGFCCYKYDTFSDFSIGDICVMTPSEVKDYHGLVEATQGTFEKVIDDNQDETAVLVDATISEIKNATDMHYQGMYVRLKGVSASATNWANGITLSKDGVSIGTYNNASLAELNTVNCTFDALCVVDYYDGYRLIVMSVDHITEPAYINLSADISSAIAIDGSVDPVITVSSNVAWTAQVTGGADLLSDVSSGEILVDVPANTTGSDMTYVVTVTSTEDPTLFKTIELVQSGPYIKELSADHTSNIAADGSVKPIVTVDANVNWSAEVTGGATLNTNTEAGTIEVTLPVNESEQEVTYTITVTSEGGAIVKTIDLIQSAAGDSSVSVVFPVSFDYTSDKIQDGTTCYAEGLNNIATVKTYGAKATLSHSTSDGGAIYSTGFTQVGESGWEFTLPVKNLPPGAIITYSGKFRRSKTGPSQFELQYSIDGGATFISSGSIIDVPTSAGNVTGDVTVTNGLTSGIFILRLAVNKVASSSTGTHRLVQYSVISIK